MTNVYKKLSFLIFCLAAILSVRIITKDSHNKSKNNITNSTEASEKTPHIIGCDNRDAFEILEINEFSYIIE